MRGRVRLEKILEPGYIGPVRTRNRIIKSGAGMLMWHETDLHMREEVKAFYERLAKGGVGLIIVEAPTIDYPFGARYHNRYRIDHDRYIPGLAKLVQVIHKHGCPAFMQMNHDGPWQTHWGTEPVPVYEGQPVAASSVYLISPYDHHNEEPRPLTVAEIEAIVDKFASAAERAKKAGFDGVDINAASSHLLHSFLSPFWNRRDDLYGGSTENRTRFLVQIVKEIKRRLGSHFPVSVIINGIEIGRLEGIEDSKCLTHEESKRIAKILEQAGVDAIQVRHHWIGYHVAGFLPDTFFYPEPPIPIEEFPGEYNRELRGAGANIHLARGIKEVVGIPVTVVGRMDPFLGEKVLREGMADFIAMTRRLIADPELPNKLASSRIDEIAPCTGCTFCLGGRGRCRINGLSGTPYLSIEKAERKKKVLVVGGGPSGMEAARVSALRGHTVTLIEKGHRLGGLLPLAAFVKGSYPEDVMLILRYLERQLRALGIRVVLRREATVEAVEALRPDVVFVATGGIPTIPPIPGIEGPNVLTVPYLHRRLKSLLRFLGPYTLRWLTRLYLPVGRRVLIIGGGIHGLELAEFLVKRGRAVTIVDELDVSQFGQRMTLTMRSHLMLWFDRKGVRLIGGVREYKEINRRGLVFIDAEGVRRLVEAETIIPALPLKPDRHLYDLLKGKVPEVYCVGDCDGAGTIADAIGLALRKAIVV